jgi:hypothetical protein
MPAPTDWASRGGGRALLAGLVPRLDLARRGAFYGRAGASRACGLWEAVDLIAKMPATYMTYANGGPVLPTVRRRALGRFSVWVEPVPNGCGSCRAMRDGRSASWTRAR